MQQVENVREDARVLYHQGHDEDAIELLRGWLRRYPDDASGWEIIAAAYFNLRRYPEAESAARRTVELWPESARAWSNWGTMLRKLGRHDEARGAQQRARRLDPYYERPHVELAKLPPAERSYTRAAASGSPQTPEYEQAAPLFADYDEYIEEEAALARGAAGDGATNDRTYAASAPRPAATVAMPSATQHSAPPAAAVAALPSVPSSATPAAPQDLEPPVLPPERAEPPPALQLATTVCARCGHTVPAQTYCVHCGRTLGDAVTAGGTPAQRTLKAAWCALVAVLLVVLGVLIAVRVARG